MQPLPSRFHGFLAVPAKSPTDWDQLATHYRSRHVAGPISLNELLCQRSGLNGPREVSAAYAVRANRCRLAAELCQALVQLRT